MRLVVSLVLSAGWAVFLLWIVYGLVWRNFQNLIAALGG
jgi:hypothetical protein